MKIRDFLKRNWNYILIVLLPWILVLAHSLIRDSWPVGNGSILKGDTGTFYYEMYVELWNRVHDGGTLLFSWNTGGGTDFLVQIFNYMISPFTLLILCVPKTFIANMLQIVMVLKWSCLGFTMMYYFMHTRHNTVKVHKRLVALAIVLIYCFSNVLIYNLEYMSWYDVLILFPILLLLEEKMAEGKGFKRFGFCLAVSLLCNFGITIPVSIFLAFWYILQLDKGTADKVRNIFRYIYSMIAAYAASMIILLPGIAGNVENSEGTIWEGQGISFHTVLISVAEFVQKFFVCDSPFLLPTAVPMLYCSVVAIAVALLFVFLPVQRKKKVICILLTILLTAGMFLGGLNVLWHGYFGINEEINSFAFLFVFLIAFMVLEVLAHLEHLRVWNIAAVLVFGLAGIVYTFFHISQYLDFYVYMGTVLLFVLILLLLIFFCRKSITYPRMLVVFSVFCFLELAGNAFYQFSEYNMYAIEETYYHKQGQILSSNLELDAGEKVAYTQVNANYGMITDIPSAAGELYYTNDAMQELYKKLGLAWTDDYYTFFGGSPLLNVMFNIRYGLSQDSLAFSDVEQIGENGGYQLYEMKRLCGAGYLVNSDIVDWDVTDGSPFDLQNEFVTLATGEEDIFEIIEVDMTCQSLLGGNNLGGHHHEEGEDEHEEDEHDELEGLTAVQECEYDPETRGYAYPFIKMYAGDIVTMRFQSDGVTDYYVYMKSSADQYSTVYVGADVVYDDMISSKNRMFHIGVVEEGKTISIASNAIVDDLSSVSMYYQFAGFKEENFAKAYDILSDNVYEITDMTAADINGVIEADERGIMLTCFPARNGFTVLVDGNQTEYDRIGNALIGVPLEKGTHTVELHYITPYLKEGAVGTAAGILLFLLMCMMEQMSLKKGSTKNGQI